MRVTALLLAAAAALAAQEVKVYSEFQRIDPFGNVAAPDAGAAPREILSPLVARNAWASFHVACTVAPDVPAFLYLQQNPELFEVKVYKEIFTRTPRGWIPNGLQEVTLPYTILLPDAVHPIPGQTTVVFWLDIKVPARTPPGRMRFQAVMKARDRWLVYPMEVRVAEKAAAAEASGGGPLPPLAARADAALLRAVRERLCKTAARGTGGSGLTVHRLIRRNAAQDIALAGADLARLAPAGICGAVPAQAEWWLSVRRAIYQQR